MGCFNTGSKIGNEPKKAGIVVSVKTKDQKETGWGASNLDWKSSSGRFHDSYLMTHMIY